MEVRKRSTRDEGGDWNLAYADNGCMNDERVQILMLSDIRREARKQTAELARQTEIFRRIDERLKRNGMSLAKRNRK